MNTTFITGATGFAGSHILECFENHSITIACCRDINKLPKKWKNSALAGDLKNDHYINELTIQADTICHAAAWAEMNGQLKDSENNYLNPTLKLIDYAIKNKVKRFIFLSSITSKPIEEKRIHCKLSLKDIWPHYASVMKIEDYLASKSEEIEVVILRVGFFVGKNYALGILPILLPRLKTHLVPWINAGRTTLPLIDGRDIGEAFYLSCIKMFNQPFTVIDIVGSEIPTVKEVFIYLNEKHNYPLPHFSVSFSMAFAFARFMRWLYKLTKKDPLIVPAIVLLLEETNANNNQAEILLGFKPKIHWQQSIDTQINEMQHKQSKNMKMNKT